ncbi:MAG: SIS domain-containing protein [Actinobacteria bacterium]|nr:SIS domain-containing protein [Actinomycetota bacterium]
MTYRNYNTYKEIMRQPQTWKNVIGKIVKNSDRLRQIFIKDYDKIIIFGCGSSYNLSQSAAFFTRYLFGDMESQAIPSSEILLNPDLYIKNNKRYMLVGFSRSGETTESVDVLKNLKDRKNLSFFTFTCRENSSFSKLCSNCFVCEGAVEKSIVMTESFSSMLLAFCLTMIALKGDDKLVNEMFEEFNSMTEYIEKNISFIESYIKSFIDNNSFDSYFTLGSGFNYGLAVEADLKMKEMSQVPSYSYHLYEFSHGPKSLLNEESLCVILALSSNLIKYEKILKEFYDLGPKMLVIGSNRINSLVGRERAEYILGDSDFKFDIVKSFINIPVFQMLAFFKTLQKKLNPDLPKNLVYTVKI